jgi:hypothetical protein
MGSTVGTLTILSHVLHSICLTSTAKRSVFTIATCNHCGHSITYLKMTKSKNSPCYYEPKPKHPTVYDLIAPEHYRDALGMERRNGAFIIKEHPIFKYSRDNPPLWVLNKKD